jgi:hypothetical protein
MKRLLLIFVLASPGWATLPFTSVWEVRTTGADTNGGGFDSAKAGTDYSQQNAAQFAFTDLASSNGSTSPCAVTSASHNFVAADVGNFIQITAGTNWTTGFYEIVSAAGNAATLDRACGSAASISSGTWAEGGALATPQKVITGLSNNGSSGYVVWIKAGTYTVSASMIPSSSYDYTVIGYNASRGDNPTGNNRPLVTTSTNSIFMFQIGNNAASNGTTYTNMRFSNTAVTRAAFLGNNFGSLTTQYNLVNCSFTGFSRVVDGGSNTLNLRPLIIRNSEIASSTDATAAILWTGDGYVLIQNSSIHDSTGDGIRQNAGSSADYLNATDSIFYNNGGKAIHFTNSGLGGVTLIGNAFVSNTSDGFAYDSGGTGIKAFFVQNNIFWGNGGWGININTGIAPGPIALFTNAFGSNTSGTHQWGTSNGAMDVGDITLTATPFNNAASGDFSLNSTAGGGALVRGAGFPGTLTYGGTGYISLGAVQPKMNSGSAGGSYGFVGP